LSLRDHVSRAPLSPGTVAAAAALTVAAYTQTLPAPLQNVAYHVLGFVGVPQAHRTGRAPGDTRPTRPARTHSASQAGGVPPAPAKPASPEPTPARAVFAPERTSLLVAVASHRVVAGQGDVLAGRLTALGKGVPGARLYLLERTVGGRAWHVAGHATTGRDGRVFVNVSGLTRNAVFRLRGPHGALSEPVRVIVIPPVSASLASGPARQADTVTASCPLAAPRDLAVLQVRVSGRWVSVQVRELYSDNRVRFVVRVMGVERAYRVVLLATSAHGRSVSNAVTLTLR
jgi:hypothetical protein